jgi:hypothetical protein
MNLGGSTMEQCHRGKWANIKGGRHSPLHRAMHNLATGLASIRRSGGPERVAWAEVTYARVLEAIERGERNFGRQAFRDYMNRALQERHPHLSGAP